MKGDFAYTESHRADCYRYLSACFYQPDKSLFKETNILNNLKISLDEAFQELAVYADDLTTTLNKSRDIDLLIDYSALFLGPFELKAPPYGSVYLEKDRRLMGDTTMKVIEFYEDAGLILDDEFKDAPDHIAAELEFVYYLVFKEVEQIKQGKIHEALNYLKKQKFFVESLFVPWVTDFCKDIKSNAQTDFYKLLSDLLLRISLSTTTTCDRAISYLERKQ